MGQTVATIAGVAGTRIAFSSLDDGPVSFLSLALISCSALALALCRSAVRISAERLGQTYTADIRQALFSAAMKTPAEEIAKRRRGYLMLRLTGGMAVMKDGLSRSIPQLVQAFSLSVAGLIALALMDARFFAIACAMVVVVAVMTSVLVGRVYSAHATLRQQRAKLAADMAERLPIAPDLIRLGRRRKELARLRKESRHLGDRSLLRLRLIECLRALPEVLSGLVAAFVLFDGSVRGLPAGEIAASLAALGLLAFGLLQVSAIADRLSGWKVASAKLEKYLSERLQNPARASSAKVKFAYPASTISIEAPEIILSGSISASIGSLVHATCHQPERILAALGGVGSESSVVIKLDGALLEDITAGSIRRNIGIVSTDPTVLKGSVRRNLTLALRQRPNDTAILRRIGRAGLQASLDELGGLDGRLSEGARTLADSDRIKIAALQTIVARQRFLIVSLGSALPSEDVSRYLQSESVAAIWLRRQPA